MPALVDVIEDAACDVAAGVTSLDDAVDYVVAMSDEGLTPFGASNLIEMEVDCPGSVRDAYERVFSDIVRYFEEWLGVNFRNYPTPRCRRDMRRKLVKYRVMSLALGVSVAVLAIIIARRGHGQRRS